MINIIIGLIFASITSLLGQMYSFVLTGDVITFNDSAIQYVSDQGRKYFEMPMVIDEFQNNELTLTSLNLENPSTIKVKIGDEWNHPVIEGQELKSKYTGTIEIDFSGNKARHLIVDLSSLADIKLPSSYTGKKATYKATTLSGNPKNLLYEPIAIGFENTKNNEETFQLLMYLDLKESHFMIFEYEENSENRKAFVNTIYEGE